MQGQITVKLDMQIPKRKVNLNVDYFSSLDLLQTWLNHLIRIIRIGYLTHCIIKAPIAPDI